MGNIVKLDIMSDGSVSLDGTRITSNKMYGIQSVVKSVSVSKESIVKALDVEKEIRAKIIDGFAEEIRDWQVDIHVNEYDADKFDFVFERIFEIAEELKGGAE